MIVVGQAALAISPVWAAPLVPLAAALPTVAVLLYLMRQVSTNLPWAQLAVAVLAGAFMAPIIDNAITVIGAIALGFVDELPPNTGGFSESRRILLWALLIPAGEELAKQSGILMLRKRVSGPGAAFLIGAAAGASFAIMEDYFYIGGGLSSASWFPTIAGRSMGVFLHPIAAGILSLAVYAALRGVPGLMARLMVTYTAVVGLHGAWNFLGVTRAAAGLEHFLGRWVELAGPESLMAGLAMTAALAVVFSPMILPHWWVARATVGVLGSVEDRGTSTGAGRTLPGGRIAALWPISKLIHLIEVLTWIPVPPITTRLRYRIRRPRDLLPFRHRSNDAR